MLKFKLVCELKLSGHYPLKKIWCERRINKWRVD